MVNNFHNTGVMILISLYISMKPVNLAKLHQTNLNNVTLK